jgi:hypothetical protein
MLDAGSFRRACLKAVARHLCARYFAGLGFRAILNETPLLIAFCRVAPSVRFKALAIFASGSFPAMLLRVRMSSFDQGFLVGDFLAADFVILFSSYCAMRVGRIATFGNYWGPDSPRFPDPTRQRFSGAKTVANAVSQFVQTIAKSCHP